MTRGSQEPHIVSLGAEIQCVHSFSVPGDVECNNRES